MVLVTNSPINKREAIISLLIIVFFIEGSSNLKEKNKNKNN